MRGITYNTPVFYLSLGFLITVIGFYPSYFGILAEVDFVHHFHGIASTLWMVLLITQARLFQTGKFKYHRFLGWSSAIVFLLVIVSILMMFQLRLEKPGLRSNLMIWKNSWALAGFIYFYITALVNRKDFARHTRNIYCTLIIILQPAVARIFINIGWPDSFEALNHLAFFPQYVVVGLLMYGDWKKGKVYVSYVVCVLLLLIQEFTLWVARTEWWDDMIKAIARAAGKA